MLLIYNIYRWINIIILFALFWLNNVSVRVSNDLYCGGLLIYAIFGLICFYFWSIRVPKFKHQVLGTGTIDIIVMVLFIYVTGYMQTGLGILLSAPIALLSILVPGRFGIFFAAVASCMLLLINIVQYDEGNPQHLITFFTTGMYGVGFFATALTAWYFVNWVQSSEQLAKNRGKALETMQRLNEYIIERLQYGVIYVDADRHITLINESARQFFNHKKPFVDLSLREFSLPLDQKYRQFLKQKKKMGRSTVQTMLEEPYLQVFFFPTSEIIHPEVLIILEDMAVIAQQAQQLKLAALGRFSASIAHELRNPLGVVLHAAQLMTDSRQLNSDDRRLAELVMSNAHRMNSVIKNVLDVSRRQNAKREHIELVPFLHQLKHDFCLIHSCEIILDISKNKNKTVVFDKSQLEQVLIVLFDNAMQHGQDASGQVRMTLSIRHQGKNMLLILSDTGPGIPVELRHHIFEPFFTTNITGNGMGLFIAKDLCEINRAALSWVETDVGCSFAITFHSNHEMLL
jgi:two-component system sensor histidine kinase PilS (NtrC family)